MSNFADPSKTFLPLDGDAFRAPENTALPADIFAATLTGWDAYGAIKAGFVAETTQENTKIKVFNKQGTYRLKLGQEETQLRFRPVDAKNKAVALTNLRGGSVSAAAGGFEHIRGTEEEFALIIRVQDGNEWIAYYAKRAALESVPGETLDGEDIVGYDYILNPLVPDDGSVACRKFTKTNWIA
jgi:hypothetical protein